MARPECPRKVCHKPGCRYFKPQGVPMTDLKVQSLRTDELEALRLADVIGLPQAEAADRMGISQPTFNRILSRARNSVAEALVNGMALEIVTHEGDKG